MATRVSMPSLPPMSSGFNGRMPRPSTRGPNTTGPRPHSIDASRFRREDDFYNHHVPSIPSRFKESAPPRASYSGTRVLDLGTAGDIHVPRSTNRARPATYMPTSSRFQHSPIHPIQPYGAAPPTNNGFLAPPTHVEQQYSMQPSDALLLAISLMAQGGNQGFGAARPLLGPPPEQAHMGAPYPVDKSPMNRAYQRRTMGFDERLAPRNDRYHTGLSPNDPPRAWTRRDEAFARAGVQDTVRRAPPPPPSRGVPSHLYSSVGLPQHPPPERKPPRPRTGYNPFEDSTAMHFDVGHGQEDARAVHTIYDDNRGIFEVDKENFRMFIDERLKAVEMAQFDSNVDCTNNQPVKNARMAIEHGDKKLGDDGQAALVARVLEAEDIPSVAVSWRAIWAHGNDQVRTDLIDYALAVDANHIITQTYQNEPRIIKHLRALGFECVEKTDKDKTRIIRDDSSSSRRLWRKTRNLDASCRTVQYTEYKWLIKLSDSWKYKSADPRDDNAQVLPHLYLVSAQEHSVDFTKALRPEEPRVQWIKIENSKIPLADCNYFYYTLKLRNLFLDARCFWRGKEHYPHDLWGLEWFCQENQQRPKTRDQLCCKFRANMR